MNCELNNHARSGCAQYEGIISGMLISDAPFSFSAADMVSLTAIKTVIIAADNRIRVLVDQNQDHELIQQREAQTAQTPGGTQMHYGLLAHAFSLKIRRPSAYSIRKSFMDGAGSMKVYAIPFSTKGYLNPNLIGALYTAKEYNMTKILLEAVDYTSGEKQIKLVFSEYQPEANVKYHASILPEEYDPNTLDGINDVVITVISSNATTIVCSVALAANSSDIISVLATANFVCKTTAGIVQAVTATYSASTGRYTLSGTGLVTGTLAVTPVLANSVYYETPDAATITVA